MLLGYFVPFSRRGQQKQDSVLESSVLCPGWTQALAILPCMFCAAVVTVPSAAPLWMGLGSSKQCGLMSVTCP